MQKSDYDFQKFYYTKVGLGEGCGCAERVIDLHEADRTAGTPVYQPLQPRRTLSQRWRLALNAIGLTSRRKR